MNTCKVIFNGNGYDAANQEKLTKDGLWRIDSGVEAICRYTNPKNTALFEEMKVLTKEECGARQTVMLNQYVGTVEIEANCMRDMMVQHILPSLKNAQMDVKKLEGAIAQLDSAVHGMHKEGDLVKKAQLARVLRLEVKLFLFLFLFLFY